MELPLAYAFTAGMVACVNPCGVIMLPAWVSYYLGRRGPDLQTGLPLRLAQGVGAALVATAAFVLLFSAIGLVVSLGGRALMAVVPWATVAIGVALVGLGIASFTGRGPHLVLPGIQTTRGGWLGVFLFGISYAVASLSCGLPIFLVVVGAALAAGGIVGGVGLFLSYALGMGLVLITLTALAAAAKGVVDRWVRRVAPYVEWVSAVFLLGAGLYLIAYWLPTLRGS